MHGPVGDEPEIGVEKIAVLPDDARAVRRARRSSPSKKNFTLMPKGVRVARSASSAASMPRSGLVPNQILPPLSTIVVRRTGVHGSLAHFARSTGWPS
jgi:hypothetical protein